MPSCDVGKIFRDGHCKAKSGMGKTPAGSLCNANARGQKRSESSCGRGNFKPACTWVSGTCVPDQGKSGKTPPEKRVLPPMTGGVKLSKFMPGGKMPFNETLDQITRQCNEAGNGMQSAKIPERTAIGKVVLAYNWNARNRKPSAAEWDTQRKSCLSGIKSAYSR